MPRSGFLAGSPRAAAESPASPRDNIGQAPPDTASARHLTPRSRSQSRAAAREGRAGRAGRAKTRAARAAVHWPRLASVAPGRAGRGPARPHSLQYRLLYGPPTGRLPLSTPCPAPPLVYTALAALSIFQKRIIRVMVANASYPSPRSPGRILTVNVELHAAADGGRHLVGRDAQEGTHHLPVRLPEGEARRVDALHCGQRKRGTAS